MESYELVVKTRFAAAHNLRKYHGNCERLHGHNWLVEIVLAAQKLDDLGMVMDFRQAKDLIENIFEKLDHRYLNELGEFSEDNPTTENIARFVYNSLKEKLPPQVRMKKVTAWESEDCGASYCED